MRPDFYLAMLAIVQPHQHLANCTAKSTFFPYSCSSHYEFSDLKLSFYYPGRQEKTSCKGFMKSVLFQSHILGEKGHSVKHGLIYPVSLAILSIMAISSACETQVSTIFKTPEPVTSTEFKPFTMTEIQTITLTNVSTVTMTTTPTITITAFITITTTVVGN